jgi:hypothetical protein
MLPPERGAGALCADEVDVLLEALEGDEVLAEALGSLVAVLSIAAAGALAGTAIAAAAFALVLEGPALLTLASPAITKKLVMQIAVVVKLGLNLAVMGVVL